jgi:ABC-type phosphate transport system permease subunit
MEVIELIKAIISGLIIKFGKAKCATAPLSTVSTISTFQPHKPALKTKSPPVYRRASL